MSSLNQNTEILGLEGVTKAFGAVEVLKEISLSIRKGEFFSLLGPSGCGKTTLLRIIAGLEPWDSGEVFLEGKSMRGVPPQRRSVNTVFQAYALFPHLNVWDNIAFGLKMRKTERQELSRRVGAMLETMQLSELKARFPHQLSGGQRQRVALARAAVNEPAVLLLDEPLAAIDAKLRKELQQELKEFQHRLGITFIYVTHDQEEALTMSNRVALMNAGRIEQLGTPQEIYEKPRSRFAASFLGACNIIEGTSAEVSDDRTVVRTGLGLLAVSGSVGAVGEKVALAIRPERIIPAEPNESGSNIVTAAVQSITYAGAQTEMVATCGDSPFRVVSLNQSWRRPSPGSSLGFRFPADALIPLTET